jgi:hypothetical protein
MKETKAYLYKWTEISTGKYYIGARYANGCHPDDGYICTSKIVKPLIEANRNNWVREILCVGTPDYIVNLESSYLTKLDAKNDPMCYNKHNGDGKFSSLGKPSSLKGRVGNRKGKKNSEEHKAKASAKLKGKPAYNKGVPMSQEQRERLRLANLGKTQTEESNLKRSEALKGRKKTEEHNAKVSAAKLGKERPKVVCRLSDRKEMCLAHFNRYVK